MIFLNRTNYYRLNLFKFNIRFVILIMIVPIFYGLLTLQKAKDESGTEIIILELFFYPGRS